MRTLPLGTSYVIRTGIGAAGTAILGTVFHYESRDLMHILCLLLMAGVAGLRFFDRMQLASASRYRRLPGLW
ncbi:DMT family transporter [Pontibacter sp. HJ8]